MHVKQQTCVDRHVISYISLSYFLYSTAHPNKHGEPLCDITNRESGTSDTKLDQVIAKTLSEVNVHYPITNQLRACFKTKLWRMGQQISKASSTKRKKILENWKSGSLGVAH